jgi:hypothetical protein
MLPLRESQSLDPARVLLLDTHHERDRPSWVSKSPAFCCEQLHLFFWNKQVDSINLEADSGRLSIPSLLGLIKFVHLLIALHRSFNCAAYNRCSQTPSYSRCCQAALAVTPNKANAGATIGANAIPPAIPVARS